MIKHATASVFIFHNDVQTGWRTGLVKHPILGVWMMPGGHIETDENPAEAALREAREETGLDSFELYHPYSPIPAVNTQSAKHLPLPCWVVEHPVERDNHLDQPHIHVDFKYVAVALSDEPVREAAHPFEWFTRARLDAAPTLDDVRTNAIPLFSLVRDQYVDFVETP